MINDNQHASLLFRVVFSGIAIKCPICSSRISMEDCEKNEIECDCPDEFDRCLKLSTQPEIFTKVCETKYNCARHSKACNQSLTCESDCCDSDGCNSSVQDGRFNGTVPDGCYSSAPDRCSSSVIIAFLMVTFALVSKMCYQRRQQVPQLGLVIFDNVFCSVFIFNEASKSVSQKKKLNTHAFWMSCKL